MFEDRSDTHAENNVSVAFAMVTSLKSSLFSVHGPVHSPVHESRVQVLYHPGDVPFAAADDDCV